MLPLTPLTRSFNQVSKWSVVSMMIDDVCVLVRGIL